MDTGPIFGYFRYPYDEIAESHVVIQKRVMVDNLDAIRHRLTETMDGRATPISTEGRRSAVWGNLG